MLEEGIEEGAGVCILVNALSGNVSHQTRRLKVLINIPITILVYSGNTALFSRSLYYQES